MVAMTDTPPSTGLSTWNGFLIAAPHRHAGVQGEAGVRGRKRLRGALDRRHRLQREGFAALVRAHGDPVGDRVALQNLQCRVLARCAGQVTRLGVPDQQAAPLQVAGDARGLRSSLKTRCSRWAQPIARWRPAGRLGAQLRRDAVFWRRSGPPLSPSKQSWSFCAPPGATPPRVASGRG